MIRLTVSTAKQKASIKEAKRSADDWRPTLERWGEMFYESRRKMFDTAGRETGTPWPMYSKATNELQYAAVKGSILGKRLTEKDLLRWSPGHERLYPSLTSKNSPFSLYQLQLDRLTIGTTLEYAGRLDMGSYRMPAWAGGHAGVQRRIMVLGDPLLLSTRRLAKAKALVITTIVEGGGTHRSLSMKLIRGVRYG